MIQSKPHMYRNKEVKALDKESTDPMAFAQIKEPKPPFSRFLSINMDGYVCPVTMMKLQSVQPISKSSSYGLDICFLQTPVSTQECQIMIKL